MKNGDKLVNTTNNSTDLLHICYGLSVYKVSWKINTRYVSMKTYNICFKNILPEVEREWNEGSLTNL